MLELPVRVAVVIIGLALGWIPLACVAELGASDDAAAATRHREAALGTLLRP